MTREASPEPDPVVEYQRAARRHRRKQARRAAGVLALFALASLAMVSRMTDIGHAAGFAGLGLALLAGALIILLAGRRPG